MKAVKRLLPRTCRENNESSLGGGYACQSAHSADAAPTGCCRKRVVAAGIKKNERRAGTGCLHTFDQVRERYAFEFDKVLARLTGRDKNLRSNEKGGPLAALRR